MLSTPNSFFSSIANEQNLKRTTIYLIVMLCVSFLLQLLSIFLVQPTFNKLFSNILGAQVPTGEINPGLVVPSFINSVIVGFLVSLLFTSVLHFWLRLFSKVASWKNTYNLYVYSQTPVFLLSWLPLLNTLAWGYSVYLLVVGSQKIHKLDKKTALFVVVLPIALLFVVSTLVMFIAFSNLANY